MKGKILELQALSASYNIICITETHIDTDFYDSQLFQSKDKNIYRKDRNKSGGGVLIAVDAEIPQTSIILESQCEVVAVILQRINFELIVICYYRPPTCYNMSPLCVYLEQIKNKYPNSKILLSGDFNMPNIIWNDFSKTHFRSYQKDFISTINDFNLSQLIHVPTHIKGNILDLLFTDLNSFIFEIDVIQPGLSDHYMISAKIANNTNTNTQPSHKKYICLIKLISQILQLSLRSSVLW